MGTKKQQQAAMPYGQRRREALRLARRAADADALVVLDATDVRYLSGSTEGVSVLAFTRNAAAAFTNRMFRDRVPRECPGIEVRVCTKGPFREVADWLANAGCERVGFQERRVSLSQYRSLCKEVRKKRLVAVGDVVLEARSVKDAGELRTIRKAVRIAEQAFRELTAEGTDYFVGRSERDLAAELEYRMRMLGADCQAFAGNIIVGSGPNSANCHHRPTARKARRGEPVLFDWGAEVDGYRSDITRVVFVGSVPERFREIYGIVLAAHDAAVRAIRPRVRGRTVDRVARDLIADAGYGEEFRHGLGHGLGLAVHERPSLGGDGALRTNMVVTVEPGIYFKGVGGVRIEDDILVTASGHRRLNSLPRDLESAILH